MGEPATKRRHFGLGEPHPLLRARPPAPRLKGRCTPQHFRRVVGVRLMSMACFLNAVCWLSAKDGYCYAFQATLADQLGVHVNTIARMSSAAEAAGYVTVVRTGRENLLFPNWERLQLLSEEMVEQTHHHGGSLSLSNWKQNAAAERAGARDDAAACSSKETPEKPARARPVRTQAPRPARAGAEAREGKGAAPPEPSRAAEAPPLAQETGHGADESACSVVVSLAPSDCFAHLDAARCAELDQLGFGPVEDLLTAGERKLVLQRLGPQELFEIAKVLASQRARALPPEMRLRLRQRLVLSPKKKNFGGWCTTLLVLAEANDLAAARYEDNALMARLWKLENDAVCKADYDEASRMREIAFRVGRKVAAAIDKLEEEQADQELRALYADELSAKAPALPAPRPKALPAPAQTKLEKARDDLRGVLLIPGISRFKRAELEEQLRAVEAQIAGGEAA